MSLKTGWPIQHILELPYATFCEYHLSQLEMPKKPSSEKIEDKIQKLRRLNYNLKQRPKNR